MVYAYFNDIVFVFASLILPKYYDNMMFSVKWDCLKPLNEWFSLSVYRIFCQCWMLNDERNDMQLRSHTHTHAHKFCGWHSLPPSFEHFSSLYSIIKSTKHVRSEHLSQTPSLLWNEIELFACFCGNIISETIHHRAVADIGEI